MKKRMIALAAALLLLLAVPAAAQDMAGNDLPTGTIISGGAVVYDSIGQGATQVGTLPGGTPVIVLQQLADWTQVFSRADRTAGWVSARQVQVTPSSTIFPGIVISQSVSLRETPNTNATRLASIPNGTVLDLLDEQNGWYTVAYWNPKTNTPLQGYVRVDFIVRNPSFITTHQSTYVYAVPSRDGKKVGQVVAGTQLVVIGEYNDFWVVNLRSASGFIHKNDVNLEGGVTNG